MPEAKKSVPRIIGRLLKPYRLQLGLAGVVGLMSAALSMIQPLVVGEIVRGFVGSGVVAGALITLGLLFAADLVLQVTEMYLLGRCGVALVFDTRRTVVHKLLRAPVSAHLTRRRGDLFTGAVADTDLLRGSLTMGLTNIASSIALVLGGIAFMVVLDPLLTLVTVTSLGLAAAANVFVARRVRHAMTENRTAVGKYGAALQRALSAISTTKVSRAETREAAGVLAHAEEAKRADMRGVKLQAAMAPMINLGIQGSFAIVFTVGAARIAAGALDTGNFASYLLYLFYLLAPLVTLFTSYAQIQLGIAAAQRVEDLLELPDERADRTPAVPEPVIASSVLEFEKASFGYPNAKLVLDEVSFGALDRGLTAIVGPSGAGKTTLFSLAAGLWLPSSGRISLGGADLRELGLDSLRGRIGYVEQDAPVMDGTIEENVRYANPDATDEEVWRAIELANLAEWVAKLPDGLATQVGEVGTAISGGQRQRIAIARMLLLDPEVLLLDEATSQLDAEAEVALRRAVAELSRSRAVIAVAHRLSTVVDADRIVVLDDGRVRAIGDHQALLERDELYRRLVSMQLLPGTAIVTGAE